MKLWLWLLTFVLGVAVGASWPILEKRYFGPYLPPFLKSQVHAVSGTVVRKQRDPDRLLLTVSTELGTTLATFKEKVAEVDLLIEEGDEIAFDLPRYEPFVHDPEILRVTKQAGGSPSSRSGKSLPAETPEPFYTTPSSETGTIAPPESSESVPTQ
ncbi:MAG: hypothetical protein D6690_14160 [Nitrospirae bacterium]|nr:MAG: hypothetical protein D6690_14160 [Nitrospirota bacterium]